MGFFSSLIEGAKSAGSWVVDHAGDIASVVGTVAKIAAPLILLADDAEAPDPSDTSKQLEEYYSNFSLVSAKLSKDAQAEASEAEARNLQGIKANAVYRDTDAKPDAFLGVWKSPSGVIGSNPAIPMYQDLAKWLGTLGVPPSRTFDLAQQAAVALFADTATPSPKKAAASNESAPAEDPIHKTNFTYAPPDGSWTLSLGHAFYPLPLGVSEQDRCWHSSIFGKFHPSTGFLTAKAKARVGASGGLNSSIDDGFARTAHVGKGPIPPNSPLWVANASINWGNATIATQVHTQFEVIWQNADKDRSLQSTLLNGTTQNVQMLGKAGDNPATLRQSVISAAAETLNRNFNKTEPARNGNKTGDSSGMPFVMPDVRITKSQLIYRSL
ncbi:hypothetical protein Micbo1qcDRAFT_206811 [Microdochium bolleyi]|uniref:Uncharacterized protein n=1 Tax=Microdochium bolleyi TaxID=196109 RepID=A0A136IV20_9PEZI|nr:hypothetical protein Micbo1qcDRAFT_206811 [Microdochium bolleyi]